MQKSSSSGFKFEMLQIEIDAILLSVVTAQLVEKINRGFKFTIGDATMNEALAQGRYIKKGVKAYDPKTKLKHFNNANEALDALMYNVEVALCAGKVTADEKSVFDSQFEKVQKQLQTFITTQLNRLRDDKPTKQSSDGNAPEATSE